MKKSAIHVVDESAAGFSVKHNIGSIAADNFVIVENDGIIESRILVDKIDEFINGGEFW